MEYSIRAPDTYISMPWKNGLGTTVEVLKLPPDAETGFTLRVSMADVSTDGEFSNFMGYDRTLVLLEGNGLTLNCGDGPQHVLQHRYEAAKFSGDDRTIAKLHNGPIKDFNVIACRNHCIATVNVGTTAGTTPLNVKSDLLLVYAAEKNMSIRVDQDREVSLNHQHLLVSSGAANNSIECTGGAWIAIAVSCL